MHLWFDRKRNGLNFLHYPVKNVMFIQVASSSGSVSFSPAVFSKLLIISTLPINYAEPVR